MDDQVRKELQAKKGMTLIELLVFMSLALTIMAAAINAGMRGMSLDMRCEEALAGFMRGRSWADLMERPSYKEFTREEVRYSGSVAFNRWQQHDRFNYSGQIMERHAPKVGREIAYKSQSFGTLSKGNVGACDYYKMRIDTVWTSGDAIRTNTVYMLRYEDP